MAAIGRAVCPEEAGQDFHISSRLSHCDAVQRVYAQIFTRPDKLENEHLLAKVVVLEQLAQLLFIFEVLPVIPERVSNS